MYSFLSKYDQVATSKYIKNIFVFKLHLSFIHFAGHPYKT